MDWLENLSTPIDGDQIMDAAIDARDEQTLVLSILSHPRSLNLPVEALELCRRMLRGEEPESWNKLLLVAHFVRGGAVV